MCTLPLTTMDGRRIFVNMDLVQNYSQRWMDQELVEGTVIVYREPDTLITVMESAEDIYSMFIAYENGAEDDNTDSTDTPD